MLKLRTGYGVVIFGPSAYSIGVLKTVSVAPNLYSLTQLAGGGSQVLNATVSVTVESIPTAARNALFPNNSQSNSPCRFLWIEAGLQDGLIKYDVHELHSVVFDLPAESAVAKNDGSTTAVTTSLTGTAFVDELDEWQTVTTFGSLDSAKAYVDGQVSA